MLAGFAGRQEGMVSHAQLLAGGLGRGAIELRLRNGRLHPYHRGVYSVGHTRLTPRARLWAAVLACGGPGETVRASVCEAGATVVISVGESVSEVDFEAA